MCALKFILAHAIAKHLSRKYHQPYTDNHIPIFEPISILVYSYFNMANRTNSRIVVALVGTFMFQATASDDSIVSSGTEVSRDLRPEQIALAERAAVEEAARRVRER